MKIALWPPPQLHGIIYLLVNPKAGRDEARAYKQRFALLVMMLDDLLKNRNCKYTWARQVSILLFRTIIGKGVTSTQMRMPLQLAQSLGLHEATLQLAYFQETLCTNLFNEPSSHRGVAPHAAPLLLLHALCCPLIRLGHAQSQCPRSVTSHTAVSVEHVGVTK